MKQSRSEEEIKEQKRLRKEEAKRQKEEKKSYFSKLFNLSFIDCLHHFINKEFVKELDGLLFFDEMINDSKKLKEMRLINCEDEYLFQLKSHLENFEIELNGKSGRNRRASIDKIN